MKLKKVITVLIAVVLLMSLIQFTALSTSAKNLTITADGVNKTRDEGELIVYDSEFGETTGTNQWGYEVVVDENNEVVTVGGYNNAIPAGGFVLSGHNTDGEIKRGSELEEAIEVGDYVYYNKSALVITVSDEPVAESNYYTVVRNFNDLNKNRNVDMLIIYDSRGKKTGTNQWGYEVVVENGVVVKIGDNDNLIPDSENSFVVSGHGENVEWLKNNVKLGMTVSYDITEKTISFIYDEKAVSAGISMQLETYEAELLAAKEDYRKIDYSSVESKLAEAKDKFENAEQVLNNGGKTEDFDAVAFDVESILREIKILLAESRPVEYRGVWLRPTQKTVTEVETYVQKLYDAGINLICIETLYDCTMIMPMPSDSLFVQNPAWRGFDMLEAFINACHKRDMELHIWLPIYYVGHKNSNNAALSVGSKKPEWLSVSHTGSYYSPDDDSYFQLLSPANKEAKEFLLKTYKYILENYNIDGFQLDYIRYYASSESADFGYDETALREFEEQYDVKPSFNKSASYWNDWVAFRAQYITDMVADIRALIDEVRPSVLLGADVGANIESAYNNLYQDYMTWIEDGYLDILHPMAYGEGFEEEIVKQTEHCGEDVMIAIGLGSFMPELTSDDLLRQAKYNNEVGTDGSVFFEATSYLSKNMGPLLTKSIYKNRAITPTLDKAAALITSLEHIKSRIDDIIIPLEGISETEADKLKNAIDAVIEAVEKESFSDELFNEAEETVNKLENENAKKTLLKDLSYSKKIAGFMEHVPDRIDVSKTVEEISDESDTSELSDETEPKKGIRDYLIIVIIVAVFAVAAIVVLIIKKRKN